MFCVNCGTELSDDAKFCSSCGKTLLPHDSEGGFKMHTESKIKLVSAKCTSCGATLEVDAKESAAICRYCNSAYIVEQAINNYNIKMDGNVNVGNATININGLNVDNLLTRARNFELENDFKNALIYYNKVLDIDFNKQAAHDGIKSVKDEIENYIYFQRKINIGFSAGVLQLKKKSLVYISNKGKNQIYYLDQITNLTKTFGIGIRFDYPKKLLGVNFTMSTRDTNEWFDVLNDAIKGKYPDAKPYNLY